MRQIFFYVLEYKFQIIIEKAHPTCWKTVGCALKKILYFFCNKLLFPKENVDGSAEQVPVLADFVLQVALVGVLYPLR